MHIGIDLGTTNSALAVYDGETVSVVPNSQGESLTPSVVRLDARGAWSVGRRAFRFLESDPANTRGEWKRLMGTGERLEFEAAGRAFLPEELSAEVLRALLHDARDSLGFAPRAAVISTPALFELPQNHATARAGQLAGLQQVALIQEPIASAVAAGWKAEAEGLWLVFDLGGGTLDVSLLETDAGWLRVVDHWGDNFLGGKDFDNALVDWAIARLRARHALPELSRAQAAGRRAVMTLKAACEQAKIDLSRAERAAVSLPELCTDAHGLPVDVDLDVTRSEYEELIAPLVERTLGVCRTLLERRKLAPDAVGRVVFVGGPTLTPAVRARVAEMFGGRVAEGLDPMTAVARGAALYAATVGLEARPLAVSAAPPAGLDLRLEHPAVTADVEPFVVGRFVGLEPAALPARVRVERADGAFATADVPVGAEGGFAAQVRLERQRQNRFVVRAFGPDAVEIALRAPGFAIVHGVSIADPPLSRSVGLALADDSVHVYFEKGTPLPARRTFVHRTVKPVAAGSGEDALCIPVVQGEYRRAHRNRLIGTLRVAGARRALAAGSSLEVTLQLDRSGQLHARADAPAVGQSFEDVVHVLVPSATVETLEREAQAAEARAADLRRRAYGAGDWLALGRIDEGLRLLAEARPGLDAARGGDADAAQRVMRLLLDAGAALDDAEQGLEWPELESEVERTVHTNLAWVSAHGTPAEQQLFDQALAASTAARHARDAGELDRQLEVLRSLGSAAFTRAPDAPLRVLDWYAAHLSEAVDLRRASDLVERGRAAHQRGDMAELRALNRQLDELFPGSARERALSFGSGIK
jgi:molecular chaperone DnaK